MYDDNSNQLLVNREMTNMVSIQLFLLASFTLHANALMNSNYGVREEDGLAFLRRAFQHQLNIERHTDDTQTPQERGSDEQECQPLEGLLEDMVTSSHWKTFELYYGKRYKRNFTMDELWSDMKQYLGGKDLRIPEDRHTLACLAYNSSSIMDFVVKLGFPPREAGWYTLLLSMSYTSDLGGIEGIESLIQLGTRYSEWVIATGYPTLPLKKQVTEKEVRTEIEEWQRLFYKLWTDDGDASQRYLRSANNALMPVHLNPTFAAFAICRYHDTRSLLEKLCLDEDDYQKFVKLEEAKVIGAYAKLLEIGSYMIKDLLKRGFKIENYENF